MQVKIEKYDHLGDGIGHFNDKVIFVKRSLPKEEVEVEINKNYSKYSIADIKNIIKKNPNRVESICPYYNECGGCDFCHTTKEEENDFKLGKAYDLIEKVDYFYQTREYNYRNKVLLHVEGKKIGFYKEKTKEIINIEYCYLLDNRLNEVIKQLHKFINENDVYIEEIMIRVGDDVMLVINGKVKDNIKQYFPQVSTITVGDEIIKGNGFIYKTLNDYKFKISPKSFFQVNYDGLLSIYKILQESLTKKYNKALDLYSGTSVMGILISSFCKKVISVECNKSACLDAKVNIKNNHINNVEIINNKVENIIDKLDDIDLIIIDPPRSGLDKKTKSYINRLQPETLVYISCNMITLKRDLSELSEKYKINNIYLVDMFPKTYHVECVCILKLK